MSEAESLVREAMTAYERLAAPRRAVRASSRLRSVGLRLGRRGPQRRPSSGWESLTASERDVAELVAAGLTNREIGERLFVSPRTVESHIGHMFVKLGQTSRAGLAAEVTVRARVHLLERAS